MLAKSYSREAQSNCAEITNLQNQIKNGGLSKEQKSKIKKTIEELKGKIKPFKKKKKDSGGLG